MITRLSLLTPVAAFFTFLQAAANPPADTVPGPFQVYMATGPRAGMFHAPICEYDLNPGVLIFLKDGAEFDKGVIDLLKKLEALIPKYPQAKVGASLIVLGDGGYRKALETPLEEKKATELGLTVATLAKEGKDARLDDLAKKENLNLVTLGFADPSQLAKYGLDPAADVNVLFINRQQTVSKNAYPKGALTDAAVAKLLEQVEATAVEVTKAAARRKWTP